MENIEVLEKIGLNQKQAEVYLGLLELGTSSVEGIARKAGTKRPTTYLVLDELQKRGLVAVVPRAKKALFTAESPEKLLSDLTHKQELVKRFLPEMLALHNAKPDKPQVQLFEGEEGVRGVYKKICVSKEVWFFSTLGDLDRALPGVTDEVLKQATEGKLKIREMLTGTPEDLSYASRIPQNGFYETKLVPTGFSFLTDNAIYGDTVAFFSFASHPFAVVITSKEISGSVRSLFELAWQHTKLTSVIPKKHYA